MNRKIGIIGSTINALSVFLFAIFMLFDFTFGSFFVCILLAISYLVMAVAIENECKKEHMVAGKLGLLFGAIYATLIMVVYFTQCTSVTNEALSDGAAQALDYKRLGLMFNLDLLGYGIMALSTFFIGLSFDAKSKIDKALKYLLMIHGVFFFSCLIMPMTGMFVGSGGSTSSCGTIALEIWCAYFLPIGILSALHFRAKA